MLPRIALPVIFLLLIYGFWLHTDFKAVSLGLVIFLLAMLSQERVGNQTQPDHREKINPCQISTMFTTSMLNDASYANSTCNHFIAFGESTIFEQRQNYSGGRAGGCTG